MQRNRWRVRRRVAGIVSAMALAAAAVGGWSWHHAQQAAAQTAARYQHLMALTALQPQVPAPDFTLTDQNGQRISLSALRGKVVVLEFMDPECTDICPIVSAEIVEADHLLGARANDVQFLAVNVNQYHESPQDMAAFTRSHGLNALPNWHFLTGSTSELKAIWKAYGIQVIPNPTGDVEHSSFMYFIAKDGTERFLANPDNAKTTIGAWAHGIRYVLDQLV